MSTCLISLGSNLGNRAENIKRAIDGLAAHPHIKVIAQSQTMETAPVGGPEGQGNFLNGAVLIETTLDPQAVLAVLLEIESQLARVRSVHWGPRTIDLDLLLFGDEVINSADLQVPHPLMHTRHFVLQPAAQIAPDMVHSKLQLTVAELLNRLNADTVDGV